MSAPLLVDSDIVGLTLPSDRSSKEHLGLHYVGSAEQSFYQLIKDGFEPVGKYMMLTPCHRDEVKDERHLEIFLKIELVSLDSTYHNIAKDAFDFYTTLGEKVDLTVVSAVEGVDLEIGGVEVGSYGQRMFDGQVISYGTGLALPRFSQVRKNKK